MFVLNNKEDVCAVLVQYFIGKGHDEFERWKPLITESDRDKKHEFSDVGEIDEEILSCITEDGWYKSYIPEKVIRAKQHCYGNTKWLEQIDKDYERVVLGEIPWHEFYEMHRNDRDKYIKMCSFNDFLHMISEEEDDGQNEI